MKWEQGDDPQGPFPRQLYDLPDWTSAPQRPCVSPAQVPRVHTVGLRETDTGRGARSFAELTPSFPFQTLFRSCLSKHGSWTRSAGLAWSLSEHREAALAPAVEVLPPWSLHTIGVFVHPGGLPGILSSCPVYIFWDPHFPCQPVKHLPAVSLWLRLPRRRCPGRVRLCVLTRSQGDSSVH